MRGAIRIRNLTCSQVGHFSFDFPRAHIIAILQLMLLYVGMVFLTCLPEGNVKKRIYGYVFTTCCQVLGGSVSAVINFHDRENIPKNGICVANHTTPLDAIILACDNPYDLVRSKPNIALHLHCVAVDSCKVKLLLQCSRQHILHVAPQVVFIDIGWRSNNGCGAAGASSRTLRCLNYFEAEHLRNDAPQS